MQILFLLGLLAGLGVAETAYMIHRRITNQKLACPINHRESCAYVMNSKYNKLLVIHNDLAGLVFYLAVITLVILLMAKTSPHELWRLLIGLFAWSGAGISITLVYIQGKILKAWCVWCVGSAGITIMMAFLVLLNYYQF